MKTLWLLLFVIPLSLTYQLCTPAPTSSSCLPCPVSCRTCSSTSTCASCQIEYYASSGVGLCLSCPQNCQNCTSGSICVQCNTPYVLNANLTCSLCVITNAVTCSSTVAATSCSSGYYLSDSYCMNCLLNCISCTSSSGCSACAPTYYLNMSVITCNPCPQGCSSCNQYTPTVCTGCSNGYQLANSSCLSVSCPISNCKYCSNSSTCIFCQKYYYWNGSNCLMGASITCEEGANGMLPTSCINGCSSYAITLTVSTLNYQCKPYSSVYLSSVQYRQLYYYASVSLSDLNVLASTSATLSLEANGQQSFPLSGSLTFTTLPNYYRIIMAFKYAATSNILVNISASTPTGNQQSQSIVLNSTASPQGVQASTAIVHSNNLVLAVNSSLRLVEMWLRLYKCSSGCTICLNQQLCELCDAPYFMLSYACVSNCSVFFSFMPNRTCLTSCPGGYYSVVTSSLKYCQVCQSPCYTCTNTSFCLSCTSGYYYYNYTCSQTCPQQYYTNSLTSSCQTCISPCYTCLNATTCLSCSQGFWNGSACINSCPSGYYGNSATNNCSACSSSCLTCITSASTCTSCISSLILQNQQCLSSCPPRYYQYNNTCLQCQAPCYTCLSVASCLTCAYNYLLNYTCLPSCPLTYFIDQANYLCVACTSPCYTCGSSQSCTSCSSGCLYSGNCPSACPSTLYFPTNDSYSLCKCEQCLYPCSSCSSATVCLGCLDGYLFNGTCLTQCPNGYYQQSNASICLVCTSTFSNCLQCSSTGCTLCQTNYLLFVGTCAISCPSKYYEQNQICVACQSPCYTCFSSQVCLTCISPYALMVTSCLIQCPTGYISLTVNSSFICSACQPPCFSCSVNISNCTYCRYGYYLYSGSCLSNCSTVTPILTYYNEDSTLSCSACQFPCNTCSSETYCLSCRIGYLSSTGLCQTCSLGTFPNNGSCINCPSACQICYSLSFCTACNAGYYLLNNQCVSNSSLCILNGYYIAGRVCYLCLQPCKNCYQSSSNCTSCLTGYIYYNSACIVSCPNPYFSSNNTCQPCLAACASCTVSDNYCLSCNSPYLLFLSNASCLLSCPSSTYQADTICSSCQYPCATCTSETACLTCTSGVLVGSVCYSSCLSGYYATTSMVCSPCSSTCSECISSSTNCTQCPNNYWLINTTCIASCPQGYFPQSQSQQCLACVVICYECSSYVNCTACASNLVYYYSLQNGLGECVTSCPRGYYQNQSSAICIACLSQCLSCSNGLSCLSCSGILVQYNGNCLTQCPANMYSSGGICQNCSYPCFNCTDAYTCSSCADASLLLVASSSCLPGPTCPSGYYLFPNSTQCNSECPSGYYYLDNLTCNKVSCGSDSFMGADWHCYSSCPSGYLSNTTFHCLPCTDCSQGLFFSVQTAILKDSLYLYIIFTQTPNYTQSPSINLNPSLPYQFQSGEPKNSISSGQTNDITSGSTNLTLLLPLNYSIQETQLVVTFLYPLQTFSNPLQQSLQTVYIDGYDYYPSLPFLGSFGFLVLFIAIIGTFKNPLMTDFAQIMFLLALLNCHYPYHLASFLQSTGIANLHGLINIAITNALGDGKFLYVSGTSFIPNTIANWVCLVVGLFLALILYFVYRLLQRKKYHRVHEENEQQHDQKSDKSDKDQQRCASLMQSLQNLFDRFKEGYLSRLIYFNYLPLSLFAMIQLGYYSSTGIGESVLSIITLLSLILWAWWINQSKPKYTFLYMRKLLISAAVVLSLRNAIYAIGIISVSNLMAALLILTHKLEKYRWETYFQVAAELLQFFLQAVLSFFIMLGQGHQTSNKVLLAWLILFTLLTISLIYTLEAIFQLVVWIARKRGVDLTTNWVLNNREDSQGSQDSQSNSASKKMQSQQNIPQKQKEELGEKDKENLETLLVKIRQEMKQEGWEREHAKKDQRQLFWAYGDSQSGEGSGEVMKAPQALVRCINEFSDLGSDKGK